MAREGRWRKATIRLLSVLLPVIGCAGSRALHDGDEVRLEDAVLVAHLTPGHTKGCTTWTMKVTEGGTTPFIDPEGYQKYVAQKEQEFLVELARQRAAAPQGAGSR